MSRKKKKSDNWFNKIFTRKRADRTHNLPYAYIEALADQIHKVNPTKQIIINSLVVFAEELIAKGYIWSRSDDKFFRGSQERGFKQAFDIEKNKIDDLIHVKSNEPQICATHQ